MELKYHRLFKNYLECVSAASAKHDRRYSRAPRTWSAAEAQQYLASIHSTVTDKS